MASVDSGVETGNESNDGSFEAKNDTLMGQISTVATIGPFELCSLPESPSRQITGTTTGLFFGAVIPHIKFPETSLPSGFDSAYAMRSLELRKRRNIRCTSELGRSRKFFKKCMDDDYLLERKLRVAVKTNNIELVQHYLFSGVNPNCVDSMGRSPLHLASSSGYADIVRLLLENGANPNLKDQVGNTPLHLAACTNNIVVVTFLLKAGTDVRSIDLHGRNPLQLAQSKLRLLQKHMHGSKVVTTFVKNPALQFSLPTLQHQAHTFEEIPVYDNALIANQAVQIVEMMRLFLQKRGQESEAELLSTFSTHLTLSETKEQVETQVRDLLDNLSNLSLDTSSEKKSMNNPGSSFDGRSSCIISSPRGINFFSNALPAPRPGSPLPSSSFVSASFDPSISSCSRSVPDNH